MSEVEAEIWWVSECNECCIPELMLQGKDVSIRKVSRL